MKDLTPSPHSPRPLRPFEFDLAVGAGKFGPTMAGPLAEGSPLRQVIAATAGPTRKQVIAGDVSHHHNMMSPEAGGKERVGWRGRMVMLTRGYDHDPRELYEIPEVRAYWQAAMGRDPTLLFFSSAAYPPAAQVIVACMAKRLLVHKTAGRNTVHVCIDGDEVRRIVLQEVDNFVALSGRLGIYPAEAISSMGDSVMALLG